MEVHIFVGRQPILDSEGRIYGYELLYRNSERNSFPNIDPEQATIQLLVNTFLSIGVDQISGNSKSFINFSGDLLIKDIFSSLKPEYVVIEILEDVEITPTLISRIKEIKQDGFQLALDDFILQDQYALHNELFDLIDYVKVDFLNVDEEGRKTIERFIKKYPHIKMLAEKIETEEQFQQAKISGYDLFQGYFFAKPDIIKGVEIPANLNLHMQIINRLNDNAPNIDEIATLILHDISLTYKLLRFINTLNFSIPKSVGSVKQAIVLIGLRELRRWMRILMLQDISDHSSSGRIKALVSYSMSRAKMCELVAVRMGYPNGDEHFFVGLFSLLDAIMKRSWNDILPMFPFSEKVAETLLGKKTSMTTYLELAIATERFDLEKIEKISKQLGISKEEIALFSNKANQWAQMIER
ncbi:HDOD domain-containing protein [Sporosarcina sp. ACRSL]|uniref:EAL and HDOD domain-containing protein n=1 Tax=Sporosarcina sp. ACRSL TaxID=2918215 RepID=UPI001EF5FD20|nr:HDOD domain-containing protein [Sporosarcina sp. ACRSL]MCG7344344.1 HDOD domain-containing protein [Sporosarcina sp. ACRSL]